MKLNAMQIGEGAIELNEALDAMLANKIKARETIISNFTKIIVANQLFMETTKNIEYQTLELLDAEIAALKEAIGTDDSIAKAA